MIFTFILVGLLSLATIGGMSFFDLWPKTHDDIRYLALLDEFRGLLLSGALYPRWIPDLCGGYGYPTFVFYQPGYFYLASFFSFVTGEIVFASYLTLFFLFSIGGIGAYFLTWVIVKEQRTALFCAIMFMITPYFYVNLFVRGAFAEFAAMCLLPWLLYSLFHLRERLLLGVPTRNAVVALSFFSTLLVYMHPFIALFAYILAGTLFILLLGQMDRKYGVPFSIRIFISFCAGIVFSAPYWLPLLMMKSEVRIASANMEYFEISRHVVYLEQFIRRDWGFGESFPGIENDGMSFQLGLPHLALALLGVFISRKDTTYRFFLMIYLFCLFMMTPYSLPIWKRVPMIESVQFPWRLLAVTAVLQVLCLSGIVPLFLRLRNEWMFPTFILVTFLASMLYYKEQFAFEPMMNRKASDIVEWYRADKLNQYAVFAATNEFLPIYCTALPAGKPRGTSPIIEANPSHVNVFQYPDSTSFKLHLLAVASQPVWLTVNQLFLSGWKILVNGRSVEGKTLIEDLPADGRIRLYLPEGKHEIVAWYEGPPGWRSRNIAIAVFSILFVFYLCYDTRIDEFTVYIAPVGKRESSNGEIAT